jgi:hypothetical protein
MAICLDDSLKCLVFMDQMLEMARNSAAEKIAMPPVLSPKDDTPRVLATDYELQGYIDSKFLLVDSSAGYSDQVFSG